MRVHAFYMGLMAVGLVALGLFAPGNSITGFSVQGCEGCGQLCDANTTCSDATVCCPTAWESGICQLENNCAAMMEISERQTAQEYTNPERPKAINNIGFKNFLAPLLVILALVAAVIFLSK